MNCAICTSETMQAKDGLCRPCRLRAHRVTKYPFSAEMDAQLTRLYRAAKTRAALSEGMTEFAARHRMPRYIVQNRAQFLSLRIFEKTTWRTDEIEYIEENAGTVSVKNMAKRLHRSRNSVRLKLFTMGVSAMVVEGYSQRELAGRFGVNHQRIENWLNRGWLWLDSGRIPHEAVAKFVWDHMAEYRFAQAEEWWLKLMLNPKLGTITVTDRHVPKRQEAA